MLQIVSVFVLFFFCSVPLFPVLLLVLLFRLCLEVVLQRIESTGQQSSAFSSMAIETTAERADVMMVIKRGEGGRRGEDAAAEASLEHRASSCVKAKFPQGCD